MVKKFINKNIFLCHNKEILTKGLVIFKRWYGVKDEKFDCYGGSLKKSIFRGGEGFKKKQYILENCLKHCLGPWTIWRFEKRLSKKEVGVFLSVDDTPLQTMNNNGKYKRHTDVKFETDLHQSDSLKKWQF